MPISKPDHVQVHRIEFAKGTNLPRLIDEVERSIQSARYATYATVGVAAAGVVGITYGMYKIGQGIAEAWDDFEWPTLGKTLFGSTREERQEDFKQKNPKLPGFLSYFVF